MAFIFIFGTSLFDSFKQIYGPDQYLELPMLSSDIIRSRNLRGAKRTELSSAKPPSKRMRAGTRAMAGTWTVAWIQASVLVLSK